ncbi:hypothetical protein ACWGI1_17725, partial [Streptomyces sp. NPDC054835]
MTGQLAFVESPVQLLNVLEWAHTAALQDPPRLQAVPPQPTRRAPVPATGDRDGGRTGGQDGDRGGTPV